MEISKLLPTERVKYWKSFQDYLDFTDTLIIYLRLLIADTGNACLIGESVCHGERFCWSWKRPFDIPKLGREDFACVKPADPTNPRHVKITADKWEKMFSIYNTPDTFSSALEICLVEREKNQFAIAPLNFCFTDKQGDAGHANFLIFDMSRKPIRVERFEPHGGTSNIPVHEYFDVQIEQFLWEVPVIQQFGLNYIKPWQFCPKVGIQIIESNPACRAALQRIGGVGEGLCVMWSYLYVYLRLKLPNERRSKVAIDLSTQFEKDPNGMCTLLAQFLNYLAGTVKVETKKRKAPEPKEEKIKVEKVEKVEK